MNASRTVLSGSPCNKDIEAPLAVVQLLRFQMRDQLVALAARERAPLDGFALVALERHVLHDCCAK